MLKVLIIAVLLGHKRHAKYQFDRKKQNIIKHKKLLSDLKMNKEVITFGDIETEKNKFDRHKSLFLKGCRLYWLLV